jgi:outer membrane protein TolC
MRKITHVLAVAALLGGAARADEVDGAEAFAQKLQGMLHPGGLTAAEVAKAAVKVSPEVKGKTAAVLEAAALVDQTMAMFAPRLTGTARYVRLSEIAPPSLGAGNLVGTLPGPAAQLNTEVVTDPMTGKQVLKTPLFSAPVVFPVLLNNYTLQASLALPISDYFLRLVQGRAAARMGLEAAELMERATRLKVASDAKLLYYNWVRTLGRLLAVDEAERTLRAHHSDLEKMFQAGVVSKADVMGVDAQLADTELMAVRMRNLARLLDETMRVSMHDAPERAYVVGEDLLAELPAADMGETEALYREALKSRMEVKALEATAGSFREQVKLARAGYFPRLDAFGDVMYSNPNQRIFPQQDKFEGTWDLGAQLTWSPNDVVAAWAQRRGADAKLAQIEAQRDGLLDGLRLEVEGAAKEMREALETRAKTLRKLASAEESYRVRRELFRQGKATSVELSDAETALANARLGVIDARIDERVARVKLDHAIGRDAIANR